jgi:hypothetical protein
MHEHIYKRLRLDNIILVPSYFLHIKYINLWIYNIFFFLYIYFCWKIVTDCFLKKKRICCKITYQTVTDLFLWKKKGGGCRWYFLFYYHCDIHLQRWFFFQLFNWFQLFSSEFFFWMFQDTIRTGGNDHFERGCRWFQLFFIDFQLFYFLTRIIPAFKTWC